jgi:hypothetical protein
MRILSTPSFSAKAKALGGDAERLKPLSTLLRFVEKSSKEDLLASGKLSLLTNDVYVLRGDETKVFLSFGDDPQGDHLLLLDLSQENTFPLSGHALSPYNNPRVNSALNPRVNSALNPRVNSALNPRVNSAINPRVNSALNPRVNSALNPRVNSAINYRVNSQINPRVNAAVNPRINASLNPRINRSYSGPFIYDLDLNAEGFLVRTGDTTLLFANDLSFAGIGVRNSARGYTLFDTSNDWVGFLVDAGDDRYLRFDIENQWTGLVV